MTQIARPLGRRLLVPQSVAAAAAAKATPAGDASPMRHRTSTDDFVSTEEIAVQVAEFMAYTDTLPKAVGWTVMVLMVTIPDVTDGGLIMDDEYKALRTKASPQGVVIDIGAAAYRKDDDRFREGPWCKIGDRVLYGRYAGKPFQLSNGQELAFLTDTDIIATVEGGWLDTMEDTHETA